MTKKDTSKEEDAKNDDPEQSQRFLEAARAIACDQSGASFTAAIKAVSEKRKEQSSN